MATFYIPNESGWNDDNLFGEHAKLRLKVTRAYSTATNKSTLTITPQVWSDRYSGRPRLLANALLTVNGTTVYTGGSSNEWDSTGIYAVYSPSSTWADAMDSNTGKAVAWSTDVTHNSDGSVTFNFGVNFRFYLDNSFYPTYYNVSGSASATEPRASSVSASNGTFGSAVGITITRASSSFTHTVTVSCLGRTETVATKTSSVSLSWTGAVATYAPLLTNAMSTTATITCQTYSGSTLIGTTTVTITMTLPAASVKPSTTISLADPTGYANTYGAYVATKSKLRVTLTNSLKYGASLASTTITANGQTFASSPATTNEIIAGKTAVTAKITDSRGQASDTASATITILAYAAPSITTFSVRRCDQDGTPNNYGAYCLVTYGLSVTALNDHNSITLTLNYKKRSASSYASESITISSYTANGTVVFAADTESTYDVQLVLADDFSSVQRTTNLSTAYTYINFGSGAYAGIGLGMVNTKPKTVELEGSWNVERGGEALFPYPSGNGYCKLPDGTLIQWGQHSSFTLSNGVLSGTVSMSYSFVDTSFVVMITPQRNGIAYITTPVYEADANGNVTRTVDSFEIAAKGTNTNITISWLAIGRWK